ncbi:hypothetical protein KSP40_PGU018050 [Platanthera guangdongensis]|uniref:Uncharacterized protein n=1 Tax=Platanthera guangdongensis TaxID=2320717 RepID=A0ABR2MK02_9ASPA
MSGTEISLLFEKSKELDQLRKELEDDILEINKLHKKLQSSKYSLLRIFCTRIHPSLVSWTNKGTP